MRDFYKVTVIKATWYWTKKRCSDPQDRIEMPETDQVYGLLIINKKEKYEV